LGAHIPSSCPFLHDKCLKCGKIGHTQRACRTVSLNRAQNPASRPFRRNSSHQTQAGHAHHHVETNTLDIDGSEDEISWTNQVLINLKINISKFQLDSVEEEPLCGTTVNSYLFYFVYLFIPKFIVCSTGTSKP
jgi:hypothetical protein